MDLTNLSVVHLTLAIGILCYVAAFISLLNQFKLPVAFFSIAGCFWMVFVYPVANYETELHGMKAQVTMESFNRYYSQERTKVATQPTAKKIATKAIKGARKHS